MKHVFLLIALLSPWPLAAGSFDADIVVLGEVHDNPAHHARQAQIVEMIAPQALVFEMLSADQADRHVPGADMATLEAAFGWADSGWPDFAMYYPIFAAAPDARVYGAGVPRDAARAVMQSRAAEVFGKDAARFGLTEDLSRREQEAREAMQLAAHCDALPSDMLPMMVDMQRLRDAELARVAIAAFDSTGGPVVVITGNGHARTDWGMPVYLDRAAPGIRVISLGQGEDGTPPEGQFDLTEATAPRPDRADPCEQFR